MRQDLFQTVAFFVVVLSSVLSCMAINCRICNEFPHGTCCDTEFPGTCKASSKYGPIAATLDLAGTRNDSCQWMSLTWTDPPTGMFISSCAERWDDSISGATYRVWWQSHFNVNWQDKFTITCQ
eukprot:TRINITY_DN8858_c0_g1_i1.p1 TRINITY_DN8858_c0_g1~~TRINITY_DN8858_c0_g1_i1.p1  ORF type:complete len:124 (+),score=11.90 TRINITY_DN8858_c0_g1_i1:49-420(+)